MVSALCPFPFRATLKFGAVSDSPSREGYTISGSDAVTTSPDSFTYKILCISRFGNTTSYLIKELFIACGIKPQARLIAQL
ncbi:MAG: hypothetical protein NTV16_06430 [Actinobacteria bacterium]|nr:hypothetical protein [Actinomycetota bacterium]